MSEEAKDAPAKKKKGKLPIIIVLVLVLAGGGFMKMKSGGKKPPPPAIKLGEYQVLPEMLVNLRGSSYLRAEIALQTSDKFKKEEFDKVLPGVRDAVVMVLTSKSLSDVNNEKGKLRLKREIAYAINKELAYLEKKDHPEEPEKAAEAESKEKKGKKGAKDAHGKEEEKAKEEEGPILTFDPEEMEHPEWDSDTGPVLRVKFTTFATQ